MGNLVSTKTAAFLGESMSQANNSKSLVFTDEAISASPSQMRGSILETALALGVSIDHSCGGFGTCGTCRVFVKMSEGEGLPCREDLEREMAEDRGFAKEERLACQTPALAGMLISKKSL